MSITTTLARRTAASAIGAVLALGALGTAAHASQTPLEKKLTGSAYSELGAAEYPAGSNRVPNEDYGSLGAAWCAHFVTKMLARHGIAYNEGGRGEFNYNVARAWSVYGPKGGGYGRPATTYNPNPGDLVIDKYDGTASTGGHIWIVIKKASADGRYVWSIGGNEGDAVRLQKKDLAENNRYLVTLSEFRNQTVNVIKDGVDVGDVQFARYNPPGGEPNVDPKALIRYGYSGWLTGDSLHNSTWGISGRYPWSTARTGEWAADTAIPTENYEDIWLLDGSYKAVLSVADTAVDPARATSNSETT